MDGKNDHDEVWVVDSGVNEHITCIQRLLENVTKNTFKPPVTIPNGDSINVEEGGDCKFQNNITIDKVLHIPDFNCNLLYVSRLTTNLQCAITFLLDFCNMQDLLSQNLIGMGECK